jgi:hypothetical protein
MSVMKNIWKLGLTSLLLLVSITMYSQEDRLIRAGQLYRSKSNEPARLSIDSVIVNPQTKNDFTAWTLRAYIYYDKYKVTERSNLNSPLRDTVISSIKVSNRLQPDSTYVLQNNKLLTTLGIHYNNISKTLLEDSINNERSTIAYNKFKEINRMVNPNVDFINKDIEYYLALGSQFSAYFIKDNSDTKSQNIAKVALFKVLELQPDNKIANVNMGLMYYTQAVYLSKSLDFGADFSQIDIVQDNMVKLAKQAEQYIVLSYQKDNTYTKAIEALYYIYRMLNEPLKSEDFKKKAEALGVKFVDEPEEDQK